MERTHGYEPCNVGSNPMQCTSYPKLQFDVKGNRYCLGQISQHTVMRGWNKTRQVFFGVSINHCLSTSVEKVSGCGLPQPAWDSSLRGRSIGLKNRRMVDRYHSVPPFACEAHMDERRIHIPQVVGSNPTAGTNRVPQSLINPKVDTMCISRDNFW